MAVLLREGFDHYGTTPSFMLGLWSGLNATGYTLVSGLLGTGRALQFTSPTLLSYTFANTATLIVGVRFRLDSVSGNDSFSPILIALLDGVTTQVSLGIDASRRLVLRRGSTVIATSTNSILANTVYHAELKVTIHNTTGAYEVRVNGSSVGWIPAATNQNTRNTSNNYANAFQLTGNIAGIQITIDDLYILDTTGAAPLNDFINGPRILTLFANANGDTISWTPNGAGSNYECIDNNPPSDSVYVSDATPGNRDLYQFTDLAGSSILNAALLIRAQKSDTDVRSILPLCKSGGTVYTGSAKTLSTSWLYYVQDYPVDPDTGAAWVLADFNSAQFGMETV